MIDPAQDGVSHINVYSQGKTKLGQCLSNFAAMPFYLEHGGTFVSVEGYWYWLKAALATGRDYTILRTLYGYEAKKRGQAYTAGHYVPRKDFQTKICTAISAKIAQHRSLLTGLENSGTLPLEHYYIYGDRFVMPNRSDNFVIEHIRAVRARITTHQFYPHPEWCGNCVAAEGPDHYYGVRRRHYAHCTCDGCW